MADYVKWLKWVGLYLLFMTYPVLLIILGTVNGAMVPGIMIGTALYFIFFRKNRKEDKYNEEPL